MARAYLADNGDGRPAAPVAAWREAGIDLRFHRGALVRRAAHPRHFFFGVGRGSDGRLSLLAAGIVGVFVEEVGADKPVPERKTPKLLSTDYTSCPLGSSLIGAIATICARAALENAGAACWDAFGAVLARNRFELDARGVGVMLTSLACVSFGVSTTLFDRVRRRIGLVRTAGPGSVPRGDGAGGVGLAGNSLTSFGLAGALCQLGKPLYAPAVPAAAAPVRPARQGLAMGIDAAVNTVARCIAPLALGALLRAKASRRVRRRVRPGARRRRAGAAPRGRPGEPVRPGHLFIGCGRVAAARRCALDAEGLERRHPGRGPRPTTTNRPTGRPRRLASDPPGNNVSRARWSRRIPGVMTSRPASPTRRRALDVRRDVELEHVIRTLSEPGTAVDARAWICCHLRALAVAAPSRRPPRRRQRRLEPRANRRRAGVASSAAVQRPAAGAAPPAASRGRRRRRRPSAARWRNLCAGSRRAAAGGRT